MKTNKILKSDFPELPEIVVVGGQSNGKSSVLESIVRRDFLARLALLLFIITIYL